MNTTPLKAETSLTKLTPWLLACLVFAQSLMLRFYQLDAVPANINPDACDTLSMYMAYKAGFVNFFSFNWNGAPFVNAWLIGKFS